MINLQKIADIFTIFNALSGLIAILHVITGNTRYALLFTCYAFVFDLFDGPFARFEKKRNKYKLHNYGSAYDSIADGISFVLNPTMVILMSLEYLNFMSAFVFCVLGWYRLFKFTMNEYKEQELNEGKNKVKDFVGFPTPLTTGIIYLLYNFGLLGFEYSYILVFIVGILGHSTIKVWKPKVKI